MREKVRNQRLVRRVIVWVVGLFILAMGVAISINAYLGVSPVSSLGYMLSRIDYAYRGGRAWSTGTFINITFCFFILIQLIILRKKFKPIRIAQIVASTMFGYFVDLARWIIGDFRIPTYFGQLAMLAISIVIIALGIILFVDAKISPLPLEGLILTIVQVVPKSKFHIIKMMLDSALVVTSIALSFIFLGSLVGIREGTIIAAICVGRVMPWIRKAVDPLLRKIDLYRPKEES
ncbi:MAG: DUF6198 family protein [Oscillospiraceae bacterium]|nr:DUF6198 family protein [Oscillospiraceae bacterium]